MLLKWSELFGSLKLNFSKISNICNKHIYSGILTLNSHHRRLLMKLLKADLEKKRKISTCVLKRWTRSLKTGKQIAMMLKLCWLEWMEKSKKRKSHDRSHSRTSNRNWSTNNTSKWKASKRDRSQCSPVLPNDQESRKTNELQVKTQLRRIWKSSSCIEL